MLFRSLDTDLGADDWKAVIVSYKALVEREIGKPFPQDPRQQLWGAIGAVFGSWMNARAVTYRRLHDIPASWGTAVNVQAMVFGNMGETSATGVAFTRHPSTGEKVLWGEFLMNAQGEDVVAGTRTPQDLTERARIETGSDLPSLEASMPETFAEFSAICDRLERHHRDVLDLEFTVERVDIADQVVGVRSVVVDFQRLSRRGEGRAGSALIEHVPAPVHMCTESVHVFQAFRQGIAVDHSTSTG